MIQLNVTSTDLIMNDEQMRLCTLRISGKQAELDWPLLEFIH
jgi:hypothetical protein